MNFRWYIPVFVLVLAILGISVDQSTMPNQEIVVQFDANSISSEEAQQAISKITEQLKTIGVDNIHVSKLLNGKLKVTYYSAVDVAIIKNLLHKQNNLQLDNTSFNKNDGSPQIPFNSGRDSYKLDVVIIQKGFGSDLGLQGLPVVTKFVKENYLNPDISISIFEIDISFLQDFENVAYKNYRNVSLLIDVTSHKIPEVRAGPFA